MSAPAPLARPATYFHAWPGLGFPLVGCSYHLIDGDGNPCATACTATIVRVTAANGDRFVLRDRSDIQRFLVAIGCLACEEVAS